MHILTIEDCEDQLYDCSINHKSIFVNSLIDISKDSKTTVDLSLHDTSMNIYSILIFNLI